MCRVLVAAILVSGGPYWVILECLANNFRASLTVL